MFIIKIQRNWSAINFPLSSKFIDFLSLQISKAMTLCKIRPNSNQNFEQGPISNRSNTISWHFTRMRSTPIDFLNSVNNNSRCPQSKPNQGRQSRREREGAELGAYLGLGSPLVEGLEDLVQILGFLDLRHCSSPPHCSETLARSAARQWKGSRAGPCLLIMWKSRIQPDPDPRKKPNTLPWPTWLLLAWADPTSWVHKFLTNNPH